MSATDSRRRGTRSLRRWFLLLTALLVAVAALRSFFGVFSVPSESMEPLLRPGDRLAVVAAEPLTRGDVVVFDATGSFLPWSLGQGAGAQVGRALQWLGLHDAGTHYVKRILGLPGDKVACCDPQGRLTLNGSPVEEDYLFPGDPASRTPFTVAVPDGRLWMMGDHRSRSQDSRAFLGAPGGGFVPVDQVVGRVDTVVWPPSRWKKVPRLAVGEVER